jgi:hypothetical protein
LDRTVSSVQQQSVPVEHLVGKAVALEGLSDQLNRLAEATAADWLIPLPCGDTLDPDCVRVLLAVASTVDVVVPWVHVNGAEWSPNRLLSRKSVVRYPPPVFMCRRSLWEAVGGRSDRFWWLAVEAGAVVVSVPEVLGTHEAEQEAEAA